MMTALAKKPSFRAAVAGFVYSVCSLSFTHAQELDLLPLTIDKLDDETLQILWPAQAGDFLLEESDLGLNSPWELSPWSPVFQGDQFSVFIGIDREARFYRLRRKNPEDVPFRVLGGTPLHGANAVGVTVRPQVFFSKPVDPTSLAGDNFFASAGEDVLAARIVPANDGTFAWLFFDEAMPGGSLIEVVVDGSTIFAADGTGALDADGDGTPGGVLTFAFSTLNVDPVPGTSLTGIIADPGPDRIPFTADDFEAGPDGEQHTQDDRFLLPIEGVKVSLLGLPGETTTGADGQFSLDQVPGGAAKVVLDGMTATSLPAGIYFPEMVMHAVMNPGVENWISPREPVVYLPRISTSILEDIDAGQATQITVSDDGAPDLPPEQRQFLSVDIQPNSLLGTDGQPLAQGQVGISTVPPEAVRDMLPPGLLQHTFDITIQAPGIGNFAQPAPMTFPNVFGAAPGEQLNFLSFDHNTGLLVIEGTATVSADGLSVRTDPGTGITHPGWHGVSPPGGCGGSGGPPPEPPKEEPDEKKTEHDLVVLTMMIGNNPNTGFPSFGWSSPPLPPGPAKPPKPGCGVPSRDKDQSKETVHVKIEVDGPLAKFAKPVSGGLPLTTQSFTLKPGGGNKKFGFYSKSYSEMFGAGGIANLQRDALFGARIKITKVRKPKTGSQEREIWTYYAYRWVDVIDADKAKNLTGNTAAFHRTLADGSGGFVRRKNVSHDLPNSVTTSFDRALGSPFSMPGLYRGKGTAVWTFDPSVSGDRNDTFDIEVNDPKDSDLGVGQIEAIGTATNETTVDLNLLDFEEELERIIKALRGVWSPGDDGAPGVKGVDDDNNGTTDDATEYGLGDDGFHVVYDLGGGTADSQPGQIQGYATLGADGAPGKAGVNDDGIGNTDDDAELGYGDDKVLVASDRFESDFGDFLPGIVYADAQLEQRVKQESAALFLEVINDYSATIAGGAIGYSILPTTVGADVRLDYKELPASIGGEADHLDLDILPFVDAIDHASLSPAAKEWALAETLNPRVSGTARISPVIAIQAKPLRLAASVAQPVSHEIGHLFGLNESYKLNPPGNINPPGDIMRAYSSSSPALSFATQNVDLLQAALGLHRNADKPLTSALKLYRANYNLPNDPTGIDLVTRLREAHLAVMAGGSTYLPNDVLAITPTAADGTGGTSTDLAIELANTGNLPLSIQNVSLANPSSGFSIVNPGIVGSSIAAGETSTLTIRVDPAEVGSFEDMLTITSNGTPASFSILLRGLGISPTPHAEASLAGNNNLGGVALGNQATTTAAPTGLFVITNRGATTLTISAVQLVDGTDAFKLLGVPADLATNPVELAYGETFAFGRVEFAPAAPGLDRAVIHVTTNDPDHPTVRLTAVGTGLPEILYPEWGKDFVSMESTVAPAGTLPLRTTSDTEGNFEFFVRPQEPYHLAIFDPKSGLISHGFGTTNPSGRGLDVTKNLAFDASVSEDGDFDGLPDDVEFAIGTSPSKADTDGDGLLDFTEIEQGLDPLGGRSLPTGTVAVVSFRGEAHEIAVRGSLLNTDDQTLYVANGTEGLAIIDASNLTAPVVISQLRLAGLSTGVAIDANRNLAAVAGGSAGLHLIDVTDPMAPKRLASVLTGATVQRVEVFDGIAYVASGTDLVAVDLTTREVVQTLELAGGPLTDVVRDGVTLLTMDNQRNLRAIDIDGFEMVLRDSLTLTYGGGRLFAGDGVLYALAADYRSGGYTTVDVSAPQDLTLISDPDIADPNVSPRADFAANGSGLGLLVGRPSFGGRNLLEIVDVSDPSQTYVLVNRFDLPIVPQCVTVAGGIGFLGSSQKLLVANYLPFDNLGLPPSLSFTMRDDDPGSPGLQVTEGRTVPVRVQVTDDVQVRNVELLLNGRVVANDSSFPFELNAVIPSIRDAGESVQLQVRATDTGGNAALSTLVVAEVLRDQIPPTIEWIAPVDGALLGPGANAVQIGFSEPMDELTLNRDTIFVRGRSDPDNPLIPQVTETRREGRHSIFIYEPFGAGEFELVVKQEEITDRSSNALGTQDLIRPFTVAAPYVAFPIARYSSGSSSTNFVTADINRDGKPDFIAANFADLGQPGVSVVLGRGRGTFAPPVQFDVGAVPFDVRAEDLNGDGWLDLVTTNPDTDDVSVIMGQSDGGFGPPTRFPAGDRPTRLVVGDFSGDDRLDVVSLNGQSNDISLLLGNGDGTFLAQQRFPVESNASHLIAGHFNDDTLLDLAVANGSSNGNTVSVLLGAPGASFQNPVHYTVDSAPATIKAADLDDNGALDLITANQNDWTVSLLMGQGDGTFADQQSIGGLALTGTKDVTVADFDADETLDLAVTVAGRVVVLAGVGDGTFDEPTTTSLGFSEPRTILAADLNGDTVLDLATSGIRDIAVLLGVGDGSFLERDTYTTFNGRPQAVGIGDFTGDDIPDAVVSLFDRDQVMLLLNDGDGGLQMRRLIDTGSGPNGLVVADLNEDDHPDIAVTNSSASDISVLIADGEGGFQPGQLLGVGSNPVAVAAGDVDGDDHLDLVVANSGGGDLSVLLGDGSGGFAAETRVTARPNPVDVDLADLDGDEVLDLVTPSFSQSHITVMKGQGDGSFTTVATYSFEENPASVVLADFSGDDVIDLAVTRANSHEVAVRLGEGDGTFSRQPQRYPTHLRPLTMTHGDLNGDGLVDLLTTNFWSGDLSLLLGKENGEFEDEISLHAGGAPTAAATADFDGDGFADIIATSDSERSVSVLFGH